MHGENCPFHPIFLFCDRTRITEKAQRKPVRHCQKPVIVHMLFLWFLGVIQIYELHALSCVQEGTRRRPDNVTACGTACLWSPVPSFPTRWAGPLTRDPKDLAPEIIRKILITIFRWNEMFQVQHNDKWVIHLFLFVKDIRREKNVRIDWH